MLPDRGIARLLDAIPSNLALVSQPKTVRRHAARSASGATQTGSLGRAATEVIDADKLKDQNEKTVIGIGSGWFVIYSVDFAGAICQWSHCV